MGIGSKISVGESEGVGWAIAHKGRSAGWSQHYQTLVDSKPLIVLSMQQDRHSSAITITLTDPLPLENVGVGRHLLPGFANLI